MLPNWPRGTAIAFIDFMRLDAETFCATNALGLGQPSAPQTSPPPDQQIEFLTPKIRRLRVSFVGPHFGAGIGQVKRAPPAKRSGAS
jgi:hypothetical protein